MSSPPPHNDANQALRAEPTVRVGVILRDDRRSSIELRLPDRRYVTDCPTIPAELLKPAATLAIESDGQGLAVRIDGRPAGTISSLRLSPGKPPELAPGVGVLVRAVPAGRGFHWQKNIDQTLAGAIELRLQRGCVILINELPLEDYLAGVITAEMSGDCPADLLKAQCVVARSWLLALTEPKHEDEPFDRCNDDCCQRYQGTAALTPAALEAVHATRGEVLLNTEPRDSSRAGCHADGRLRRHVSASSEPEAQASATTADILDANYSKCCGGVSELPRHVWGFDKPGLSAIVDAPAGDNAQRFLPVTNNNLEDYLTGDWLRATRAYCSPNVVPPDGIARYLGRVDQTDNYFRWTVRYTRVELEKLLRQKLPETRELAHLRNLKITERGVSGRASRMEIDWENQAGEVVTTRLDSEYEIRRTLHEKFLYSSAIVFHVKHVCAGRIDTIEISGAGWGHGVGMCQIGALGMALSGIDYQAICMHYYPDAHLATIYE